MSLKVWLVDEVECRARLEQMVAKLDADWTIIIAEDGEQAIEAAQNHALDAVICSYKSTPYAGNELLKRIQQKHAEALRVLAVPADMGPSEVARLSASESVQQIIVQPFSDEDVTRVLNRLLTIHDLIADPQLRAQLGALKSLPSSPTTFLSLRAAIADEDTSMSDVVARLSKAPALAARVLQLANSAMFSRGRAISDLLSAIQRLGLNTLSQLVLSSEVFSALGSNNQYAQQLEFRALLAARLAQKIAPDPQLASMASSAALLADIGKLLPDDVLLSHTRGKTRIDVPRADLLGACLLALWGLPMELIEAVAFRHVPSHVGAKSLDLIGTVHIAAGIAADEPLDEAYLQSSGQMEKLYLWQEMANELKGMQA